MDKISISLIDIQETAGDKQAIDFAASLEVDGIDFDLSAHNLSQPGDIYSLGEDAVRAYFTDLYEYANAKGVNIVQTHGRLYGYGVDSENNKVFLENARLDMIATAILGAKYCVVHTPALNWVGDLPADQLYEIGVSLFTAVLSYAAGEGVTVAAETHGTSSKYSKMEFFGIPDNLLELLRRVKENSPYPDSICVCVDTGHTNLALAHGYPPVGEVIRYLGSLVKVLHLHDNNGIKDQHKMPLTGDLDWKDIISAIRETGFDGYFNLEVMLKHFGKNLIEDEARFSVKIMQEILKNNP